MSQHSLEVSSRDRTSHVEEALLQSRSVSSVPRGFYRLSVPETCRVSPRFTVLPPLCPTVPSWRPSGTPRRCTTTTPAASASLSSCISARKATSREDESSTVSFRAHSSSLSRRCSVSKRHRSSYSAERQNIVVSIVSRSELITLYICVYRLTERSSVQVEAVSTCT